MRRTVSTISLTFIWLTFTLIFLVITLFLYSKITSPKAFNLLLSASSRNIMDSPTTTFSEFGNVLSAVKSSDARGVLVDIFLERYDSPMIGLGDEFVEAADQHGLDWRFLPALAFQESNLGKKIPKGSNNPFGWAVYSGSSSGVNFGSWEEGIFTVAADIKENYIDQGLTSPEQIVTRYTSNNNPEWVFAVRSAMEEIASEEY
jgi:hypothetical protein